MTKLQQNKKVKYHLKTSSQTTNGQWALNKNI